MISRRIAKLRRRIRSFKADSALITNFTNVTYLTGFTGDDSYLLVSRDEAILISDPRYTTQAEEECPELKLEIRGTGTRMVDAVAKVARRLGVSEMLLEASSVSLALAESLQQAVRGVSFHGKPDLVEPLRLIKDPSEVAAIREAVRQAERAFQVVRASLLPDQTEQEVAHQLEHQIRQFGGRGCSFDPIVAVGTRAALPHATPTQQRIGDAPFVLIDWGATERLYRSDLTRILVTGKIPAKFARVYEIVLAAQKAGIQAIRPGVSLEEVDRKARSVIEKAGFGKRFGHGLGHGIGLDIHEAPRLASNQPDLLQPGMVVTVEPGVYLPGWGGVRIEDDVLVTRTGHEVLSSLGKELADAEIV